VAQWRLGNSNLTITGNRLALIVDIDADSFDTPAWSGLERIEENPTLSPITWDSQGLIAKPSGDMTRHLASGYGNSSAVSGGVWGVGWIYGRQQRAVRTHVNGEFCPMREWSFLRHRCDS